MRILVLNSGSSSIKYRVYDDDEVLIKGLIEQIGEPGSTVPDHAAGFRDLMARLADAGLSKRLDAIGHRVVHGGEEFFEPSVIDAAVIERIRAQIPLAPLHNPSNLTGIEVAYQIRPDLPQVAVFDTAFHRTMPPRAYRYALPESLYSEHGVRRYGFHGTSHAFVAEEAVAYLGRSLSETNLITLHLGNGASMTAIEAGRSVDTSMGMSPLEGLVMGTRSGDIDPAIVFHLVREAGMAPAEVEALLNHESGLKGMSGDNDMRAIQRRADAGDTAASLALDVYCHRIKKYLGAYYAVLGQVDAIVFTGGVGENQPAVREKVTAGLERFGIIIDPSRNAGADASRGPFSIHAEGADVAVLVVATDEELSIARQARMRLAD
jgi:acetate kinase